jgi:hypothetical protein
MAFCCFFKQILYYLIFAIESADKWTNRNTPNKLRGAEENGVNVWTTLISLRIWDSGGSSDENNETSGSVI